MSTKEKLIQKLKVYPKDFSYDELETLLLQLGFVKKRSGKTTGSAVKFQKGPMAISMHKPHPSNQLKMYVIKSVISALEREKII